MLKMYSTYNIFWCIISTTSIGAVRQKGALIFWLGNFDHDLKITNKQPSQYGCNLAKKCSYKCKKRTSHYTYFYFIKARN